MSAPRTIHNLSTGKVTRSTLIPNTDCGKNGYTSRKVAAAAAKRATNATGQRIEAYRCKRGCHCWHIGHPAPRSTGHGAPARSQ